MTSSQRALSLTLPLALALSLGACGAFGGKDAEFVEQGDTDREVDVRTGPETKGLVKRLPAGLIGDKTNARHTYETLKGEDTSGNN